MNTPDTTETTPSAPQKRGPGRPRTRPPKRKLTPEELSRIRAEAGRKGGLVRKAQKIETMPIRIRASDMDVVKRVMSARRLSAPLALHLIVEFFSKRVEF